MKRKLIIYYNFNKPIGNKVFIFSKLVSLNKPIGNKVFIFSKLVSDLDIHANTPSHEAGWLVVSGLTALLDSISVYIGPSPRKREKEKRNDRREKKCPNNPTPSLTASALGPCPTLIQISRTPRHWTLTQQSLNLITEWLAIL